ncbi:aspartate/glutamate racemase family protein [Anditalea andensis]|uniref:Asp/Glu/hydantoin racemase n=1 Tax=Anditalea andensis TaxID=1048983 RepID=A0A074LKD3_9BACT|nr:aspartate/glutamate racemase family protein [Anditalea andensis]KEO74282.1 Asp/Glu/hydantoin racemase [Anditalea andensis]
MEKGKTLGLIHTSATLVPIFQQLCEEHLKGVKIFNIVDDSLIKDVISKGKLTAQTSRRVVDYIGSAEAAGADHVLVTCSSIGAAVEASESLTNIPVLRVDQPMVDLAIKTGSKIGVVATLNTTLDPTTDLVERRAKVLGKSVTVTSKLCEGAFDALMGGDPDKHDEMVSEALKELSGKVEVILLAQASMARVVAKLDESDKKVPIIASPPEAIKYLASIL